MMRVRVDWCSVIAIGIVALVALPVMADDEWSGVDWTPAAGLARVERKLDDVAARLTRIEDKLGITHTAAPARPTSPGASAQLLSAVAVTTSRPASAVWIESPTGEPSATLSLGSSAAAVGLGYSCEGGVCRPVQSYTPRRGLFGRRR